MLADFMAECLFHPQHGYYVAGDPLGAGGDFTTAPEISQTFGEMLGLCLAQSWLDQGRPAPFALAELGPGRGTLMADILRAARAVPGFVEAAQLHLVEASPALRARQGEALGAAAAQWHAEAATLPDLPLFLVANEFFDALPIRQFQRAAAGAGWHERVVTLGDDDALAFAWSAPAPVAALAARLADTAEGDIVELRPAAEVVIAVIAARIGAHGGAALIVDYGDRRSQGDTFQAVRGHAPADPLAEPGRADLTAHVDFGALQDAAQGVGVTAMTRQGILLERLGITERAQALARRLTGPALESHVAAHRRLTHPDEMGTLFKAVALHAHGAPLPPGFDP